ncbi:iron ABC transporter permease [Kineosporia sp. J2-2]|uniref:Iron ABC transporter permease n=1 Tax=Kineosporia corallincola TaxID=2835133 RepID=A0ABS5TT54_9ACTN|nr:iron ABC transporter permease [Kineosporia corallincola]MBT0773972.1 iron ABC transporter permease [Kineosporia corallincola]
MSTGPRVPAVRFLGVSARLRPRHLTVIALATLAALTVAVISAGVGDYHIPPARVVAVLLGRGDPMEELVLTTIRLPRVLLGLIVGAALGVSGAVTQATARNALASPDLLGVSAGAGVGAVTVIVIGGPAGSGLLRSIGVPAAALAGATLAAAAVLLVLRTTGTDGLRPLLVGVGVSAFLSGIVSWLMVAATIDDAARATVWLTGTLNGRSWPEVWSSAAALAVVTLPLAVLAPRLLTLRLGVDVARGLGLATGRTRTMLLLTAVILAGATTAVAGPIGFVALVVPHLARLATGAAGPPLAASAVIGALLLVSADLVARTAFAPIQIPTGAVTAFVGAPFLIWLIVRNRRGVLS